MNFYGRLLSFGIRSNVEVSKNDLNGSSEMYIMLLLMLLRCCLLLLCVSSLLVRITNELRGKVGESVVIARKGTKLNFRLLSHTRFHFIITTTEQAHLKGDTES